MKETKKQFVAPRTDVYVRMPPTPLVSRGKSLLLHYVGSKIMLKV